MLERPFTNPDHNDGENWRPGTTSRGTPWTDDSVPFTGAWLAVTGAFALPPLVLALGVLLWVAGFDLIYATQDYEFDKRERLHSMVVKLGVERSLQWAQRLHWLMLMALGAFGWTAKLGPAFFASTGMIATALIFEHWSAAKRDIAAINRAFFSSNAFVGVVFVLGVLADQLWPK